jgi:hypothetical protein
VVGHVRFPADAEADYLTVSEEAHRWRRLLDGGTYRAAGELAEAEGVTRSFVNRLLRATLLAPDIQEAIIDGRQPKGLQLEELTRTIPSDWENQRKAIYPSSL